LSIFLNSKLIYLRKCDMFVSFFLGHLFLQICYKKINLNISSISCLKPISACFGGCSIIACFSESDEIYSTWISRHILGKLNLYTFNYEIVGMSLERQRKWVQSRSPNSAKTVYRLHWLCCWWPFRKLRLGSFLFFQTFDKPYKLY